MLVPGGMYQYKVLHNAATADADGATLNCIDEAAGAYSVAVFQITGTFTATVYFECTVNDSTWVAMEAASAGVSATVASSATAAGVWRASVLGYSQVRARLDWTSGTSVTVVASLVA